MHLNRLFVVVAGFALSGCGHYLQWKAQPPAAAVQGKISIAVADVRPPQNGGTDKRIVAMVPGFAMIPTPQRLATPEDAANRIGVLIAEAAQAAGIGLAAPGEAGTAKIMVDMGTLWCTGFFPVFIANSSVTAKIVDPATGAVRVQTEAISAQDGAGDCQGAHRNMLTKLFKGMSTMFATPAVKDAIVAAPAAPAAPAPVAAPADPAAPAPAAAAQ